MQTRIRCVLLCEDLQHERLVRPILERKFGGRVRVHRAGTHSFVVQKLPKELAYLRQRPTENVALVVTIDGDEAGFDERKRQLQSSAQKSGEEVGQRVAILVPCRTIETWILWLGGRRDLNESTDVKRIVQNLPDRGKAAAREAVNTWFEHPVPHAEREAEQLPALAQARKDLDQLAQRF